MDRDLSSLLGGRYIYFKSLDGSNAVFQRIYQDAVGRLSAVSNAI